MIYNMMYVHIVYNDIFLFPLKPPHPAPIKRPGKINKDKLSQNLSGVHGPV